MGRYGSIVGRGVLMPFVRRNGKRVRVSKNGRRLGHITGIVYLVHAARALHGSRHYLGFTTNVRERVARHKAGRGTPLLGEMTRKGISWRVVRTWRGKDGYFEQQLKAKGAASLCPVCRGR
jgi:predicted GIY-YIG superfamily endonuclease